ncbi:hypothetical protein [Rubrivirga sp. SAORIC476]|uniref:hypothetical protein n=1 Tax=Rubrivirga sp. SAORIC476 TaxID=1961794 RepID=UPI00117AB2CE|nr:hypothetical protein [Rubrivirga sp. SAORIC476]
MKVLPSGSPVVSRLILFGVFLLAPAAAAQDAPDVVGTWELVDAENVPYDDLLVFARLTFTPDRLDAVYVFLDPDDGELSGRFEDARVQASAGQLVVRDGAEVTVLDVTRDATLLRVLDLETGIVLNLRAADPEGALDPDLVGGWSGTRFGRPFGVRFGADGRAEVREGDDRDEGTYVVAGPYVLLGDDPARYTFRRDASGQRQLVVEADGEESVLSRIP